MVLSIRLARSAVNALLLQAEHITYWTDSANVLWCIRRYTHKFKPFIANRVGEIHLSSSPNEWRCIPTAMNSADHLTCGFKIKELVNLKTWWESPEFLKQDELTWPKNVADKKPVMSCTWQGQKILVQCCLKVKG